MKQIFKRFTAICVLAATLLGLVGGVPMPINTSAANTDADGNTIVNLLDGKNPSFEEYTIPGWSTMAGVVQSDEHIYGEGGKWSLKLCDTSASSSIWSQSDEHEIIPGDKYTVSARVYGGVGQMTVYFYDASGNTLTNQTFTVKTNSAADTWQMLSKSFTAASDAKYLSIKVSSTDAGKEPVWFDAVVLASNALDGFKVELKNGDFSADWGTAKMAPGWVNNWSANAKFELVNGALAATKLKPTGQVGSDGVDHGYGYYFSSDRIDIIGGYAYNASIDIKLKTGNSFQMYLRFYEGDAEKPIETVSGFLEGDYTSEWVTVTIGGIAPKTATKAMLYITDPYYSDGVSYFDNASISMANQVGNASMEVINSNKSPLGYAINRQSSIKEFSNTDAAYVKTGKASAVCQDDSLLWSTYINVDPNENYVASIWAKREAGYTDDCTAVTAILFYDKDGKELQRTVKGATPVSDKWTQVTASAFAPEEAVTARMLFYKGAKGSGKVYFDDASITKTTDYKIPLNMLNNGSFETRSITKNSPLAKWNLGSESDAKYFAVDYTGGDRGYTARVYNTTYMLMWSDAIPVTPGKVYSVTGYAKGEGRLQAVIRYYTEDTGTRDGYMKDASGKDLGKGNSTDNLRSTEWSQLAVAGSEAPKGAKYARIWVVALPDTFTNKINFNFDDIVFFNGQPNIEVNGESGILKNAGFEEINSAYGLPEYWGIFGSANRLSVANATDEPDDVFEGQYALKIHVPETLAGTFGTISESFPVQEGVNYCLSFYAKEDFVDKTGFQVGIKYYDKNNQQLAVFYVTTPATGEWNYSDVTGEAPIGAIYARVYIVSGGGKGTVCFDKLNFAPLDAMSIAPEMYYGDWSVVYNEYPRLDFDQERLEQIRRFSNSKAVCAYGYAGTVTKKSLVSEAEDWLAEDTLYINHKGVHMYYPLYPVAKDPSTLKEFETPPEGQMDGYPYMTAVGSYLLKRVQTLAFAYAVTGDARYGERAKQYALDICDWQYWIGYHETVTVQGGVEKSSQATGYLVDCVIAVYDMCNDLLSDADKAKMEKNLVEKGLEPMYYDCWPRMIRGRDMDHATGMILGACTILREDNIDQLKKYLDMGMTYINWRLNQFMYSGVNEGHSYDSLAIDDIVITLYTLERVTGYTGPLDHPYIDELEKRVLGFFDMVNGELPAYSDCNYSSEYYPYSMAVFSQKGNDLATYYLAVGGALASTYDKLVWFTDMSIDEVLPPDERLYNVTFVESHGFGALRTGWEILDSLMVINTNNSQKEHNHYDQNSIMLAFNGSWILSDTGYKDMSYSTLTTYQMKYTNTTIFVDGKPQIRKGQGTLEQVFNTHVYGYFLGSAPDAYGMEDKMPILNKFDRHMIMINHDSQPYYVIIDDLDSNKERNFGWNIYTNGWDRLEIDGEHVAEGASATGNRVTLSRFGSTLHCFFVGEQITSRELTYDKYGPTLLLESSKKQNHQFMNILSIQKGSGSQLSTMFEHLMKGQSSTTPESIKEGEISWSTTRSDTTKNTILSVSIGSSLVMFRAGNPGDWITFPFEVPEKKEYGVTIEIGQTLQYTGKWKLYVDDTVITEFEPHGPSGIAAIDAGKMNLSAGLHTVKVELIETPETAFGGTICSIGGITLDTGESMGEGIVKVTDQYNDGDVLGATITYGTVLKDVVLFNRGVNEISAGGVVTNGQQASIIGINGTDIAEGYAVTKGTYLKYNGVTLVQAEAPVSIAMDYTMAKFPVKNDDTEALIETHEDFDIKKPVYYVSTKADADVKTSILVGVHAPYTVYIDGEVVESTHSGEMLTLTIPAGEHQIEIRGTHQHVFNQHSTHVLNAKEWAGCGHANIYYVSCECGENGTETFEVGAVKGHTLEKVAAKEPTETEDGNIEYWGCSKCGKYFADAEGTQEVTLADVTLLNKADARIRQILIITGIVVGVLILAGGAFLFFAFRSGLLKKKKTEEMPAEDTAADDAPVTSE